MDPDGQLVSLRDSEPVKSEIDICDKEDTKSVSSPTPCLFSIL